MERLQKVIAASGFCSRRKAEEFILKGQVKVNGEVVTMLGVKVNSDDLIEVDGTLLQKEIKKVYYLLNKPSGYICSLKDEKNRKLVTDLIPTSLRIYPVGRLDYDTTGLLILTNDGDFANLLMHPSNEVEKSYRATVDGILSPEEIYSIKYGIVIEGRKVIPTRFKIKSKNTNKNTSVIEISIIEGRNHIVKKIFEMVGHPVLKLKRERYAFLDVHDLRVGEYRTLTIKEIHKFYELKK